MAKVQSRLAKVGLAKQGSKGTAATDAEYVFGVLGGSVTGAEITEEDVNTTWTQRVLSTHERLAVVPGTSFETLALPKMVGLLLYGVLGSISTTGADPYTHEITPADSDLPYLTEFARQGSDYFDIPDAKIDELEISWDRTGAVRANVTTMGLDLTFDGTDLSSTTGTEERPADGVLKGVGGTFDVDGAAADVVSGSVSMSNSLDAIAVSHQVLPIDVFPGMVACNVSLTIIPDDLTLFREVVTGTAAGTSVSADVNYGAFDVGFVSGSHTLDFNAPRCAFRTNFPEANPDGGPVEITLEGAIAEPSTGDAIKWTLVNDVATY